MPFIEYILDLSLPGIVMFSGLILTLLGSGVENQWKIRVPSSRWRLTFTLLGIPTFILGVWLTVLVLIFGVPIPPPDWVTIGNFVFSRETLAISLFILVVVILVMISRERLAEKGYKINASPVLDREFSSSNANILVQNVGVGKITCVARLMEITAFENGIEKQIDINEINPWGKFLPWNDKTGYTTLIENVPQVVNVASLDRDDHKAHLVFFRSRGRRHHYMPLDRGKYRLRIEILRVKRRKHICMCVVERMLEVKSDRDRLYRDEIEWLVDERSPEKDSAPLS